MSKFPDKKKKYSQRKHPFFRRYWFYIGNGHLLKAKYITLYMNKLSELG